MLSASSAGPYMPDMPMHPRPTTETAGPPLPSARVCMRAIYAVQLPRATRILYSLPHDRRDACPAAGRRCAADRRLPRSIPLALGESLLADLGPLRARAPGVEVGRADRRPPREGGLPRHAQ